VTGAWDPVRYERFKSERTRPFFDLLALLRPAPGGRAVDLGCGTGELTRALHEKLQLAETLGLDSSPEMLARSGRFAGGGLTFARADIADDAALAAPGGYDVVFSNAALHWVDDHPSLLRRLTRDVRDGGQLAIQVPANHDHPSHRAARAVAAEEPFLSVTGGLPASPVLQPEDYAGLLYHLGYRAQVVRLEVYGHVMTAREEIVDWIAGTTLTPIRARLDDAQWARFLDRYRQVLLPQLDDARPYFYTFKRILLWGQR
jgi:trans-aconitate 2-methyltransferase